MFDIVNLINSLSIPQDNMWVEFKELEDRYYVYGKMPGVMKKDININYDDDYLSISVNSNISTQNNYSGCVCMVQQMSNLQRRFYLPNVDVTGVNGGFDGTNLTINLPKFKEKVKCIEDPNIIDVEYEDIK